MVELGLWRWAFDCLFILATLSLPHGWVRLVTMSIQLFVHSCDPLFLLVELGLRRWAFNCLFILTTLSLPPGWVRLATMSIGLFVHSYNPFSFSWLSSACDDEHSIVCSFLRPFLFLLVELGLRRWAFDCLFILTTLSLSPGWVRLVAMSIRLFVHSYDPFSS